MKKYNTNTQSLKKQELLSSQQRQLFMFLKPFLIVPLELLARSDKRGFIFYDQPAPTTACPQQMAIKEI